MQKFQKIISLTLFAKFLFIFIFAMHDTTETNFTAGDLRSTPNTEIMNIFGHIVKVPHINVSPDTIFTEENTINSYNRYGFIVFIHIAISITDLKNFQGNFKSLLTPDLIVAIITEKFNTSGIRVDAALVKLIFNHSNDAIIIDIVSKIRERKQSLDQEDLGQLECSIQ